MNVWPLLAYGSTYYHDFFAFGTVSKELRPCFSTAYTLSVPTTLIVNRNAPDDAQQRQILIFLDGEQVAELMYGESVTKELPSGLHTLLVDNTWNKKSVQFDAVDGGTTRFLVKNHSSRLSEFLLMIFGAGPLKVSLERQ